MTCPSLASSITGDVNIETLNQLSRDEKLLTSDPVSLQPYIFYDKSWSIYFSATGTWVFEDGPNEMVYPVIQTTTIECLLDRGICIEVTADVSGNSLGVVTVIYDIERWDKVEIITKPYEFPCERHVLRINRATKLVKKLKTPILKKSICKSPLKKDYYLRLGDGLEITMKLVEKKIKALNAARSLNLHESLQKFFNKVDNSKVTK
jgi:hypothetical protein